MLEHAAKEVQRYLRELRRSGGVVEDVVSRLVDQGEVVVVSVCGDTGERLRHEAREQVVLASDGGADLTVCGDVVSGAQWTVEAEVQLELAGRVLVIAVAHVEAERLPVVDHVEQHRTQLLELVDVVAVGLGDAGRRRAIVAAPQPHHLGLDADQELEPELLLELVRDAPQVLARVCVEQLPGLGVVAVAVDPSHARIPREHGEGVEVGDGRKLGLLGPEADVVAVAVGEQVFAVAP